MSRKTIEIRIGETSLTVYEDAIDASFVAALERATEHCYNKSYEKDIVEARSQFLFAAVIGHADQMLGMEEVDAYMVGASKHESELEEYEADKPASPEDSMY